MHALEPHDQRTAPAPIWLKREDESAQAFAAFVVYRDQTPPRSVPKVATALERGERVLKGWCADYAWVERATAYTDHLDRLAVQAHEDDIVRRRREENDQVFQLAQEIRMMAAARLVGVKDDNDKVVVLPISPNELDADDVIRWFEASNKASRLAIGLPTDVTGQITVSLSDMDSIMRGFLRLAEKRLPAPEYQALVRDCYALVREQLGG